MVLDYSKQPGPEGKITVTWPQNSTLYRNPENSTLVMTVHAGCSCSRASIEELAKIMKKAGSSLTAHVLMLPTGNGNEQENEVKKTYVWKRGLETRGVSMHIDKEAKETKNFGALVSGTVMLFSKSGNLVFHGGITPQRGHQGDNFGEDFIVKFLEKKFLADQAHKSPVFGCHLFNPKHGHDDKENL